ncbi:hypothetical protein HYH03_008914 [Edaphochlamys debaryana]|uniref:Pherophorin domain-containing protein n=1 Tax=Edaphochlamys debaryana TaxID=47281 RepID=A0A836BYW6_9CHLO|nr:hypothetical protein HYH03_008914 [Edaphochlamys debaryana]|eukprot:KAG2492748.1 hypothetical protein HYH03_008914 [Edaphochlamys debaryana]
MASLIASGFNSTAALASARIVTPFSLSACSPLYDPSALPPVLPTLRVCATPNLRAPFIPPFPPPLAPPKPPPRSATPNLRGPNIPPFPPPLAPPKPPPRNAVPNQRAPIMPPPPPPLEFVYTHTCQASMRDVPYTIGPLFTENTVDQQGNPAVAMCVIISSKQTCRATANCCTIKFVKLEIPVNDRCRPALRRLTINNQPLDYSWGVYDSATFTTVKFKDLDLILPDPANAKMCWVVRPGPCAVPSTFCLQNRCQVSAMPHFQVVHK